MFRDDEDRIKGKILNCLKNNPKGMTVSEISKHIDLNRNSTAKYLDILRVNGRIEMRPLGRAKMFYISQRVPISALLDFSTDYIMVLDSSMRIIDVNENFQKFFNVKKEMLIDVSLISSNLPILTSGESMKKIRKALKGEGSTFEMEIKVQQGTRFFKGKLIPSTLGDGENGVTVIMENITEQKEAEIKLKRSEERYRELIDNQGEGVGITNPQDVFTFANPAAERLMGVGKGKLVGRSVMEFIPPGERKRIILHNERRSKGRKDTYQVRILTDDGKRKTILLTATPRYNEYGIFIGSFGVFRDISIMKENERKMAESEEKYRQLFEFTSDAILVLRGTRIIDCNNSTLKMFGFDAKESIIGLEPHDISPPFQKVGLSSMEEARNRIDEALEKGLISFNWIHRRIDGSEFLADVQLQSIQISGEDLFQARLRDITDLIKARRELEDKEARLTSILSSLHGSFIGLLNRDLDFVEFWGTNELDQKYGVKGRNLVGMSIMDFTHEENRNRIRESIMKTFDQGIPFRVEHEAVLPTGRFWQDWSFSPFKTDGDRIEFLVQFGRDTHEKNQMIKTLMNVEKRKMEELRMKDRIMEAVTTVSSIMLKKGDWKNKVVEALGNIGRAVDVSRVYIFRNREDDGKGLLTTQILEWTNDGITSQQGNPDLIDFPMENGFGRWIDILRNGDAVKGNVACLPGGERAILEPQEILSIAVVPIMIRGSWWGFIGFDDCIREREWYNEEIKALKLAGSMLGAVVTGHNVK
jgi:PAS domain S-box-containing protein